MAKFYSFDTEIATRFGVEESVMLQNLDYWIEKNKANGRHFHDGRYWTYNTIQAFSELFPFWSAKQIRRILQSLISAGIVITGNYNDNQRDRTIWYSIDYDALNCPNGQMQLPKRENEIAQMGKCVEDSIYNQDIDITNSNTDNAAPQAGALFPSEPVEKKQRGTSEPLCLFANSRYFDFPAFAACFTDDKFAGVDLLYYHEAVADWSAKKGKKMKDWIATARGFMRTDARDGKLQRCARPGNVLPPDAMAYLNEMQKVRGL